MVKKILSIALWVITAAALVVLFIFAREHYLTTPLKAIQMLPESDSGFVSQTALHDEIAAICKGKNIGTLNMIAIEKHLDNNAWIETNSSYVDLDGTLNVSFKEYEPKMRVFGKNGHSVYLTHDGMVLPPSRQHIPYVLIASGNFDIENDSVTYRLSDSLEQHHNLINALAWLKAIESNSFISNCVGQLYCNRHNEFELTLRGLEARVIVGDTCLAADKLERLEIFMKQRIDKPETHALKSINLNYKNQIVCIKR